MSKVGLIGLGNMGLPMTKTLIAHGHEVLGYRRGAGEDFLALGGKMADSPRDVAEQTDIILCCIPSDDALAEVISGPDGIAGGDCTGKIVVELSTLSEEAKAREAALIEAKGGVLLDGAISGLPPMVEARSAIFLLSGDEAAFETARPVLESLTESLFYMGGFGAAMKAKLCANLLVGINLAGIAETLAFGAKMGLDQTRLIEALRGGAGTSLQFQARAGRMASGDWNTVLGSTAMLAKDLHLIETAGADADCPMPVLSSAVPLYDRAITAGYGDTDVASLYAAVASAAGLPVPGDDKKGKNDE
ncbi:NAD(P)-dependent oxidoreductase [Salipiger abyssi]|uniref:3-hydroxyisobutyrate dehydrogenase n=1 Tax=Salipiger abyssi TaxID=1250539 RepID=A0A1P8UMC4_9RHOB|nr:NAD(P)-dependent oxidoreductase [Salipiger abyssi]APZ50544.1 3-hydroxyisobutyrate dehydrogenase [Salipiger abyssi]